MASTRNGVPAAPKDDAPALPVGPHPGIVSVPAQYVFEQNIRQMQKAAGSDPGREDAYRVQGVQMIDNVRRALQLPVRTFDTAAVYYHRFRLRHREADHSVHDSAMASLFVACKVEDTIKKSRDILCAAYNLKNPDHPTTPDDKTFEQPSRILIGLERQILEIIGFDFRTRHPQKYLVKLTRALPTPSKPFFRTAYEMSLDAYKTFTPLKQTCLTLSLAILRLTSLVMDTHIEEVAALDPARYSVSKRAIAETVLDLLDLYTHSHKATVLGARFDLNRFVEVKIRVNDEVEADPSLSRHEFACTTCAERDVAESETGSSRPVTSALNPVKPGRGADSTLRFVYGRGEAQEEAGAVGVFFGEEYEEYEVEVEEAVPEERATRRSVHDGATERGAASAGEAVDPRQDAAVWLVRRARPPDPLDGAVLPLVDALQLLRRHGRLLVPPGLRRRRLDVRHRRVQDAQGPRQGRGAEPEPHRAAGGRERPVPRHGRHLAPEPAVPPRPPPLLRLLHLPRPHLLPREPNPNPPAPPRPRPYLLAQLQGTGQQPHRGQDRRLRAHLLRRLDGRGLLARDPPVAPHRPRRALPAAPLVDPDCPVHGLPAQPLRAEPARPARVPAS